MHFLKEGQKIRAWVGPPPSFGQCPKENVFFQLISSLTLQLLLFTHTRWSGGPRVNEVEPILVIFEDRKEKEQVSVVTSFRFQKNNSDQFPANQNVSLTQRLRNPATNLVLF